MLLKDLGVFLRTPPILWCDNISALALASNPVFHARMKHIEVDYHFVREKFLRRDLLLKFVASHDQLADILTKRLPSHRFLWLLSKLMWLFPMCLRGDEKLEGHDAQEVQQEHASTQELQLQTMSSASTCSKTTVKGKTHRFI